MTSDSPTPSPAPATPRRPQWSRVLALVWTLAAVFAVLGMGRDGLVAKLDGARDGLLPAEHRPDRGDLWLLVGLERGDDDKRSDITTSTLLTAALSIAQALPDERVPLAPPLNATIGWLDAHGLYLLPSEAHDSLAQRLAAEPMAARVQGLRAMVSSPLFGASGIEPRRDPLALRELLHDGSGRWGHADASNRQVAAAHATGGGDLMAPDGRSVVIQLRTDRPASAVLADVRRAVTGLAVTVQVIGPRATDETSRVALTQSLPHIALTSLLLGVVMTALTQRSIRATLVVVTLLMATLGLGLAAAPTIDVFALPLLGWLIGASIGWAGLRTVGTPGTRAGLIVLALALLPLVAGPYPLWRDHAIAWTIALLVTGALVFATSPIWRRHGTGHVVRRFVPAAWSSPAALAVAVALGLGLWADDRLPYHAVDRMPAPVAELEASQLELVGSFFDPSLTVEVHSHGDTLPDALTRAAADARTLASLVPGRASRLDSPGTLVATPSEIAERRSGLAALELASHMRTLEATLASQGFRADAFAEAIAAAADLEHMPTADAALDSALGPWIHRYLARDGDAHVVRSFVQLEPSAVVGSTLAVTPDDRRLTAVGPRVAGWRDSERRGETLLVLLGASVWVGALLTWVTSRSFPAALAIALAAAASAGATLGALHGVFDHALSPLAWPGLLVASAMTFAAALPCVRASVHGHVIAVPRLAACWAAPAVSSFAFILSSEPIWQAMGVVLATGTVFGVGFGCFVAPGLCRLVGVGHWHVRDAAEGRS